MYVHICAAVVSWEQIGNLRFLQFLSSVTLFVFVVVVVNEQYIENLILNAYSCIVACALV